MQMEKDMEKAHSCSTTTLDFGKKDELEFNSECHRLAGSVLQYKWFDHILSFIIMINTVVMVMETNDAAENESGAIWIQVFGIMILFIFVVEMALRLYVYRSTFWEDPWNMFDFAVVSLDTVFTILGPVLGSLFPISMLRIFRLSKLARISKVLRVFPELRLMVAGLMGSISAIFWGTVLLAFVLLVWSMVAVNVIHPLNRDIMYEDCPRCHRAFGSVQASLLTFLQQIVTGDSWGEVSIPIIEHHPITAAFFVLVYLSVGMGVLNLIVGVVVNVFTQAHDSLKAEALHESQLLKMEAQSQLLTVCRHMDTDHTGFLTKDELVQGYHDDEIFKESIKSLDIAEEDIEVLWIILDADKSGQVSYHDFVSQVYKMRSSDSHFMLVYIKYYVTMIKHAIMDQLELNHQELQRNHLEIAEFRQNLEAELETVEKEEHMMLDILGNSKKFPVRQIAPPGGKLDDDSPLLGLDKALSQQLRLGGESAYVQSNKNTPLAAQEDKAGFIDSSREVQDRVEKKDTQLAPRLLSARPDRFEEFLQESTKMQSELLGIMKDFRVSFDQQASSIYSMAQDLQTTRKPLGLMAVPDKSASQSGTLCCAGSWSLPPVAKG